MKTILVCLLTITICITPVSAQSNEEKFKTKIVHWGVQKIVNVQFKSGEKLQGRVTEIKDDFFAVQILQQGNIATRQIVFSDIQKLSGHNEWDASKAKTYIGLGTIILSAVVLVVGITRSNDREPKTIVFSPR